MSSDKKVFNDLPKYVKVFIRITLLPLMLLTLTGFYFYALLASMFFWLRNGGEAPFIYSNKDKASMSSIYEELKKQNAAQPK